MAGTGIMIHVPGTGNQPRATITTIGGGSEALRISNQHQVAASIRIAQDSVVNNVSLVELGKQLLASARDGDTEDVKTLISKGAPFTTDWLGTSPLHLAAQFGHVETCERLLSAGISKDTRTKVDKTPLHVAAQEGHADVINVLLKNGADVNAVDLLHMTPLQWAVDRANTDAVIMLLKYGANTEVVNKFRKTALEMASDKGRPDIYEMIQHADSYRQYDLHVTTEEAEAATLAATNSIMLSPTTAFDSSSQEGSDLDQKVSPNPEAMKLLEAHGIRLLPEEPATPPTPLSPDQTIQLTEAGKLALNMKQVKVVVSKPVVSTPSITITPTSSASTVGQLKRTTTKVVSLGGTSPMSKTAILKPNIGKQPRVIKLSATQFAALKSGNSAKIEGLPIFSTASGTTKTVNSMPNLSSGSKSIKIVRVRQAPNTSESMKSEPDTSSPAEISNADLQKQLQEAMRMAAEAKKTAEELKEQLRLEREKNQKSEQEADQMRKLFEELRQRQ